MDAPLPPAVARVTIDDEQGVARLRIPGTLEPEHVEIDAIMKLVRQARVAIDYDVESRVTGAVNAFRARPETIDSVIAEQVDAVDGLDGWIEWMEGYAPRDRTQDPIVTDASGRTDHYNRIHYIKVTGETHVATIHAPTPGEQGRDVQGRVIRPQPGKPCDVRVDRSLDVRSGKVIARCGGILEFADRRLRVSRLFEVNGWVDFVTGNIDFDGTVVVREGVQDRFAIRATESIVVHGLIQAARVECGGNLIAHTGIAGKERGLIEVGGTLEAGYLDYARGTIAGDLVIAREIINCRLDIGGELQGEHAAVIGGDSTVCHSVTLDRIGSPGEKATTLVVGRIALLGRVERLLTRLEEQEIELISEHGEPPPLDPDAPFESPRRGPRTAIDQIRDLRDRIEWCRDQRKDVIAAEDDTEVTLEVGTVIHHGVRLLVGPFEVDIMSALSGPLRIAWRNHDEPYITRGGAPACPLALVADTHLRAA